MRWTPMGKSIANLYRYAQVSKASNLRYFGALAQAVPTGEVIQEVEKLCGKTTYKNRDYSGFNVLAPETCQLFLAVMNGANNINGFTNFDIRTQLFPDFDINDKRIRNKTTRILAKLRAHKLICKIPHSFKYKVSKKGLRVISSILKIKAKEYPLLVNMQAA